MPKRIAPYGVVSGAHGGAHEGFLEGGETIDGGDAEVSGDAEERVVGAEQAIQRVGCGKHGEVVGAAAALVGSEEGGCAGVLAGLESGEDEVREGDDVAEA